MLFEISFLQVLSLYLESRVYSLSFILAIFLSFTGLGSLHSLYVYKRLKDSFFASVFVLICFYGLFLTFANIYFREVLLSLIFPLRLSLLFIFLAPLAYLLGMPFMYAFHYLEDKGLLSSKLISSAWAVNGFFSVIGALGAKLLCMHIGFTVSLSLAASLYLLAWIV